MVTTTPKAVTDEVANIVRQALENHFGDMIVFDPILVMPKIDHYGDEYLQIYIVFDGDQKLIDPGWTLGLIGRIRPNLIELGVETLPSKMFVEKSEWEEVHGSRGLESV